MSSNIRNGLVEFTIDEEHQCFVKFLVSYSTKRCVKTVPHSDLTLSLSPTILFVPSQSVVKDK